MHHIALAKAYLEEGDEEKARRIIAIKRRLPAKDPTVHFEWGKLCEELGMSQQARESYEQAIALNPGNSEFHFQIAILLYERGAWERAMKHLQKTLSLNPQNEVAKKMLASLYEEIGFGGSAKVLQGVQKKREYAPPIHPIELTKEEASLILDLFKGREVGYARYHFVDAGNLAHSYMNGTMGFNEILKHVKGEETYGVYPLRSDRALKFSVIRVRVPWRRIVGNIKDSGFLAISEDNVHQYAREIVEKVRETGLSAYLEKPGVHERRIWFFFEEFIPMELSERCLNSLIDRAKAPGVDIAVSLILGFRGSGVGWQDHPVMLPLGVNKRAGKRCFFIDEAGEEHENQLLFIEKIRVNPRSEIQSFLKSGGGQTHRDHKFSHEVLLRLERECPVVEEVVKKARSGRNLRNEEKRVLYFTLGFLNDGTKLLHDVLEDCPDYRPNRVDRMVLNLGGNPISCPKIRELLPETTAYLPCNCSFKVPDGSYPSPLLHIEPFGVKGVRLKVEDRGEKVKDERSKVKSECTLFEGRDGMEEKKIVSFEDLDVYQRLCALHLKMNQATLKFPQFELFELGSQLRRSSNGAPANIAEGWNNRHINIYLEGINRSMGELQETLHHLRMAFKKEYFTETEYESYRNQYLETARMLRGLERSLEASKPTKGDR